MKILTHDDILKQLDHPFFRLISDTAEELKLDCYVIGGWVRDLYLERPSSDIDIVVVDETKQTKRPGIALAESLRHKLGKKAHIA
ncbi:MAG: tRNA nucleotidyltransferase, partial [Bacteroidaceae bacterium]|nr:tRNA nucleotidyltransferase [Bacteroidaceae bacterium]